ncbi:DUF3196 family protein [[Mycoplasma] cavipharyngis]|uniref:DUF3196 family protein n=1 Tax=[Mycoplasma] cavipharyngis TaxID=92757 RepID=UPI0037041D70
MILSSLHENLNEIKNDIKNGEYQIAHIKLETLISESNLNQKDQTALIDLKNQFEKCFLSQDHSLNNLFDCAFFANLFLDDYFFKWVNAFAETEIFELNQKQLKTLANFFTSEIIPNFNKCLVIESLAFLKLDLDVNYLNVAIKQLETINTLEINELPIYQRRDQLISQLDNIVFQDPSLKNIVNTLILGLFWYHFPKDINFSNQELLDGLIKYAQTQLEPDKKEIFLQLENKKLLKFLINLLESKEFYYF